MKATDFIDAIGWGVDAKLIKFPENYAEIVANETMSQDAWDGIEWIGGENKPSWNDLLGWYLEVRIRNLIYPREGFWEKVQLKQARVELIKHLNRKETGLHLGLMKDMSNLQFIANSMKAFGVRLRTIDGEIVEINKQKRLQEILYTIAQNENRVQNAHNKIKSEYDKLLAVANDTTADTHKRIDAATKAGNINRNYKQLLEAELNK